MEEKVLDSLVRKVSRMGILNTEYLQCMMGMMVATQGVEENVLDSLVRKVSRMVILNTDAASGHHQLLLQVCAWLVALCL